MHVNLFEALVDTTITPRYETKAKLKGRRLVGTRTRREAIARESSAGQVCHTVTVWYAHP